MKKYAIVEYNGNKQKHEIIASQDIEEGETIYIPEESLLLLMQDMEIKTLDNLFRNYEIED